MSNDIVAFKNAGLPVGDLAQFQKNLAQAQSNIALKGGEDFLKLTKHSGEWVYGASETEVQEGSHWAINPASLMMGFIAWGTGEVLGKKLLPILTGQMVDRSTLPNVGGNWDECISFQLRCMNGEDEGVQVNYEQNSYGAKKAFSAIVQAIMQQTTRDTVNFVPVVELKSDNYKHKQYGTIYNPIFEVVKWISMSGVAPTQETEDAGDDGEQTQVATPAAEPAKLAAKKRNAVGESAKPAAAAATPKQEEAKAPVVRQRRRAVGP